MTCHIYFCKLEMQVLVERNVHYKVNIYTILKNLRVYSVFRVTDVNSVCMHGSYTVLFKLLLKSKEL